MENLENLIWDIKNCPSDCSEAAQIAFQVDQASNLKDLENISTGKLILSIEQELDTLRNQAHMDTYMDIINALDITSAIEVDIKTEDFV